MEYRYIAVVQCHIVMERCSGYLCEKAFFDRSGGFSRFEDNRDCRALYLTCGGCCGLAVHRKLGDLLRTIQRKEQMQKDQIAVQLASCITKDNFHGPPCPHLDFLRTLISDKLGLHLFEDTHISTLAEKRRQTKKPSRNRPIG